MPCLDRFFGIEIEYRVVGPDDGFNPPGFVFEHQMNARRRRRQLRIDRARFGRSEEHTSELQSLMRISYAVFCLKQKKQTTKNTSTCTSQDIDTQKTNTH